MTRPPEQTAVGRFLREYGRRLSITCVVIAVLVVAVVDVFRIDFVQSGDADNFSSHSTAWLAVAIVCCVGVARPMWAPDAEQTRVLLAARLLITLGAAAVALDAIVDVVVTEFVLRQRVDNILAAPAFFALPVALTGVVLELVGVAKRVRAV